MRMQRLQTGTCMRVCVRACASSCGHARTQGRWLCALELKQVDAYARIADRYVRARVPPLLPSPRHTHRADGWLSGGGRVRGLCAEGQRQSVRVHCTGEGVSRGRGWGRGALQQCVPVIVS